LNLFSNGVVNDIALRPMRFTDAVEHHFGRLVEGVAAKTLARHASAHSTHEGWRLSHNTAARCSDDEQKSQHKC
jgi:hypothetical protein